MKLKSYFIDTSTLPSQSQTKAIEFIEINAWTFAYIPGSKGCFKCEWEEDVNPSLFPALSGCIVEERP